MLAGRIHDILGDMTVTDFSIGKDFMPYKRVTACPDPSRDPQASKVASL